MENLLGQIEKKNHTAHKAERTASQKEERDKQREIDEHKRIWHHNPCEFLEHIGPYKGKRIDFSNPNIVRIG